MKISLEFDSASAQDLAQLRAMTEALTLGQQMQELGAIAESAAAHIGELAEAIAPDAPARPQRQSKKSRSVLAAPDEPTPQADEPTPQADEPTPQADYSTLNFEGLHDMCLRAMTASPANQPKIKARLTELGAPRLKELAPEHYPTLAAYIATL